MSSRERGIRWLMLVSSPVSGCANRRVAGSGRAAGREEAGHRLHRTGERFEFRYIGDSLAADPHFAPVAQAEMYSLPVRAAIPSPSMVVMRPSRGPLWFSGHGLPGDDGMNRPWVRQCRRSGCRNGGHLLNGWWISKLSIGHMGVRAARWKYWPIRRARCAKHIRMQGVEQHGGFP